MENCRDSLGVCMVALDLRRVKMNRVLSFLCVSLLMLCSSGIAHAYTGTLMDSLVLANLVWDNPVDLGNSSEALETNHLKGLINDSNILLVYPPEKLEWGEGDQTGTSTFQNDIYYYAVKAGNMTAFFKVEGTISDTIVWSTIFNGDDGDDGKHGISHLTAWTVSENEYPVPEPATMLLLGFGLIGLAGVSRKKFQK